MKGSALFLVALLSSGNVWAAGSQGPAPIGAKPQNNTQVTKQSPKQEERGTEKSPLIVKLANTGKTETETANERQDIHAQTAAIERTYNVTVWLAGFTFVLAFAALWQGLQMVRTVEITRRGKQPYLWPARLRIELINEPDGTKRPSITYDFINLGQTFGRLIEYRHDMYIGKALPYRRKFSEHSLRYGGDNPIIPGGDEKNGRFHTERCSYFKTLTQIEIDAVEKGEWGVGLFGYVKYLDSFGFEHEKAYCFHFLGAGFGVIKNYPAYQYEKYKKANPIFFKRWFAAFRHQYRIWFDPEP